LKKPCEEDVGDIAIGEIGQRQQHQRAIAKDRAPAQRHALGLLRGAIADQRQFARRYGGDLFGPVTHRHQPEDHHHQTDRGAGIKG
jgi:hypothetical protein